MNKHNSNSKLPESSGSLHHKSKTFHLVCCGIFPILIALCAYIQIPFIIPITLQTFAIYFMLLLLGGKKGCICIGIYLLLGAMGIPVFSGFRGGIGFLLSNTGGYLIGFLLIGFVYMIFEKINREKYAFRVVSLILGQILCYGFGTLWFALFYGNNTGGTGFVSILSFCVLPFLLPDLIKLLLSLFLYSALSKRGISMM